MLNPVLSRELRSGMRRMRPFLLLATYVSLLGLVIAVTYPSNARFDLDSSTLGRRIFVVYITVQLILVILLTPAIAVSSLASEREKGALDALLVTPLTRMEIVFGKFLSSLLYTAILVMASLPLSGVSFLLGGVSPGEMATWYVVVLGSATVCASIGILHAASSHRPVVATASAYMSLPSCVAALIVLLAVGRTGACLVFVESIFAYCIFTNRNQWIRSACYCGAGACVVAFLPQFSGMTDWFIGISYAAAALAVVLWCLTQATKHLAASHRIEQSKANRNTEPNDRTVDPHGGRLRGLIPDHVNPVFWIEGRRAFHRMLERIQRLPASGGKLAILGLAYFFVILIALYLFPLPQSFVVGLAAVHQGVIVVWGAILGARTIAREVEGRTLPQLRVTPLSAHQILGGKFAAAFVPAACSLLVIIPIVSAAVALRFLPSDQALAWLPVALLSEVVGITIGIFWSVTTQRTRRASLASVACVLALITPAFLVNHIHGDPEPWKQLGGGLVGFLAEVLCPFSWMSWRLYNVRNAIVYLGALSLFALCCWNIALIVFIRRRPDPL